MIHFTTEQIDNFEKRFRATFINSLSGFKSVALIGTKSQSGDENVAIFSQIVHVGANPPLVGILFRPHTVIRHTLENILDTQVFTINHITEPIVSKAHHTSARWDISEFEACQLEPEYRHVIDAPYVKESAVQLGCKFVDKQNISINNTEFVIGQIVEVFLKEDIVSDDGYVNIEESNSLCSSGLDSYHSTNKIARFGYAKPHRIPIEI